jgi:hypothetical protein
MAGTTPSSGSADQLKPTASTTQHTMSCNSEHYINITVLSSQIVLTLEQSLKDTQKCFREAVDLEVHCLWITEFSLKRFWNVRSSRDRVMTDSEPECVEGVSVNCTKSRFNIHFQLRGKLGIFAIHAMK